MLKTTFQKHQNKDRHDLIPNFQEGLVGNVSRYCDFRYKHVMYLSPFYPAISCNIYFDMVIQGINCAMLFQLFTIMFIVD